MVNIDLLPDIGSSVVLILANFGRRIWATIVHNPQDMEWNAIMKEKFLKYLYIRMQIS